MALSDADKEAQLRAVGWTPSSGDSVAAAWARTATPADQAAANGSSAPAQNAFDPQSFAKQITTAMTPISQATSGVTAADLAERKRQFDATLEWQKQMWANQGLPQLQIQQQAAALAQQEFEQQKLLAQQNFQLAQAGVTGYYNPTSPGAGAAPGSNSQAPTRDQAVQQRAQELQGHGFDQLRAFQTAQAEYDQGNLQSGNVAYGTNVSFAPPPAVAAMQGSNGQGAPTLARELGMGQLDLSRANLGLDYLKTAASMGGPTDVFQADDFARGAAANGAPAFLNALRSNTGLPAFGATSGAAPTPLTAGGLMDRLGGVASPDHSAALNAIGGIAQAGGGALAPQALESLNPDEVAAMQSGFKKLGYSMPAFLQQYQQSRIGQGAAQAA